MPSLSSGMKTSVPPRRARVKLGPSSQACKAEPAEKMRRHYFARFVPAQSARTGFPAAAAVPSPRKSCFSYAAMRSFGNLKDPRAAPSAPALDGSGPVFPQHAWDENSSPGASARHPPFNRFPLSSARIPQGRAPEDLRGAAAAAEDSLGSLQGASGSRQEAMRRVAFAGPDLVEGLLSFRVMKLLLHGILAAEEGDHLPTGCFKGGPS